MSEYNLTVDDEQLQSIVVKFLKDDKDMLWKSIGESLQKIDFETADPLYLSEDLEYEFEVLKSIINVINFYSAPKDQI